MQVKTALCTTCHYRCAAIDKISSDTAHRASPSVAAELLVRLNFQPPSEIYRNYTIYEMLFNVRSKADMSQLNLPHGTDN